MGGRRLRSLVLEHQDTRANVDEYPFSIWGRISNAGNRHRVGGRNADNVCGKPHFVVSGIPCGQGRFRIDARTVEHRDGVVFEGCADPVEFLREVARNIKRIDGHRPRLVVHRKPSE